MMTTGQIAKKCKISIKTVQFYDRTNLLKPSDLSEGGRRLYSEEDLVKLKMICLYKSLGFSLNEVKVALNETNNETMRNIIRKKKGELENNIKKMKEVNQTLSLIEDLLDNDHLDLVSVESLNGILFKKKKFKRTTKMTYLLLASYVSVLFLAIYITRPINDIKMYMITAVAIILLLGLVYFHSINTAYVCPRCHKKFELRFIKNLLTLHDNKKGEKTTCPYCGRKGWFKETYRD